MSCRISASAFALSYAPVALACSRVMEFSPQISGALAVTFPMYFDDYTIVEADMVFNGVDNRWFADYNNSFSADNFVEAVALHEFGHFIGLQHSPTPRAPCNVTAPAGFRAMPQQGWWSNYTRVSQAGARQRGGKTE